MHHTKGYHRESFGNQASGFDFEDAAQSADNAAALDPRSQSSGNPLGAGFAKIWDPGVASELPCSLDLLGQLRRRPLLQSTCLRGLRHQGHAEMEASKQGHMEFQPGGRV